MVVGCQYVYLSRPVNTIVIQIISLTIRWTYKMQIQISSSFLLLAMLFGCSPTPPIFVAPLVPIEIYETSVIAGPNTKTDADSVTGSAIFLVMPAFITNVDISGAARSEMIVETIDGKPSSQHIASLDINLNATGTPKMLRATTNPASPTMAVVVNGTILSTPKIFSPISNKMRITGDDRDLKFLNAITAVTGQSK